MNVTAADVLAFIRDYGLPLVMAFVIIWSGAKAKPAWFFASTVNDMKAQYEARLEDRNQRIKELTEANALEARNAEELLKTSDQVLAMATRNQEALDRIDRTLRQRTPGPGR